MSAETPSPKEVNNSVREKAFAAVDLDPSSENFKRVINPEIAQTMAEYDDAVINKLNTQIEALKDGRPEDVYTQEELAITRQKIENAQLNPEVTLGSFENLLASAKNESTSGFEVASAATEEVLGRKPQGHGDKLFEGAVGKVGRELKNKIDSAG